jgi:hypothetical protein
MESAYSEAHSPFIHCHEQEEPTGELRLRPTHGDAFQYSSSRGIHSMALQPFIGPWPHFQFRNTIRSL